MHELVERIPGFISIKAYTGEDGEEIDLVRFANEDALKVWKEQPEHLEAQRRGREEFYDRYSSRPARWYATTSSESTNDPGASMFAGTGESRKVFHPADP